MQIWEVVLIVLERIACKNVPGNPIFGHVFETMGIVEIFVAQFLGCFKQLCVGVLFFLDDLLPGTVAVLLSQEDIPFIRLDLPKIGASKDMRAHDGHHLALVPVHVHDELFHRPPVRIPRLKHSLLVYLCQERFPFRPRLLKCVNERGFVQCLLLSHKQPCRSAFCTLARKEVIFHPLLVSEIAFACDYEHTFCRFAILVYTG
jgi:hypothetical protein